MDGARTLRINGCSINEAVGEGEKCQSDVVVALFRMLGDEATQLWAPADATRGKG